MALSHVTPSSSAPAALAEAGFAPEIPHTAQVERCGLIVESNPFHRAVLESMLDVRGYGFHVVESPSLALSACRNSVFGIILIDCDNPALDAFALCAELRRQGATSPIVALTSSVLDADRRRRKASGFDNYLQKPVTPRKLDAILSRYIPRGNSAAERHPGVIDERRVEELWATANEEASVFRHLLDSFYRAVPSALTSLRRAHEDDDATAIIAASCTLKTMSGQTGATRMEEISATIETLARAGAPAGIGALIAELSLAFERAACDLRSLEVDLLLRQNRASSESDTPGSQRRRANETPCVLLAESDSLVSAFLRNTLSNSGYEIVCVSDGPAAMAALSSRDFDAAIVATDLPQASGYEVLSFLRQDTRRMALPVLMLSTRAQEAQILRAFELGTDDIMSKPVSPLELTARLKRLTRVA